MSTSRYPQCLLSILVLSSELAQAQTAPDAGSLLQQIEKGRTPPAPAKPAPALLPVPAPMKELAGPSVTVSAFRFAGNTLLGEAELGAIVAGFLHRPLTFAELQGAAAAVADAYRKAGWIVRVYLPHQEIKDGVVTLQIIEAVFGRARIEGKPPGRVAPERLLPIVAAAQPGGALLNADALDRALLLLDDVPGVTAEGSLAAGAQANETDLVLKFEDEPLFNGEVGVDNTGARSTGQWRVTGDLYVNSPLRLGDLLAANLIHSEGSDYGRLGFSLPLGAGGARAGVNGSHLRYRLVSDDTAALAAKGSSSTAGLELSYPLIRARLRNLNLLLNYDSKRFDNRAVGVTVTHYRIDTFTAALSGNLLDKLGGGGSNSASLALVSGKLDLDDSPNRLADELTTRAAGSFNKLRYSLSRQQVLSDSLSLFASLSGQLADKNLDSAEKFYLGGAYGVRAYPSSEGGGTEGELLNLELRARLPRNVTLTGFYDWGHVTGNRDNDYVGAAAVNSYSLKGAGLSVAWLSGFGLSLKASWARRIGDNPNPTLAGNDQDGSLDKNRFWLQAKLPF